MGLGKKVTIGYWYYFGIHMGVCRGPIDELVEIRVGDRTAWNGSLKSSGSIYIDREDLFGGEKKEGGIKGPFIAMMGEDTQVADPNLETMLGGPLPGYRGVFTAFFDGKIAALNPYPKPWSFRVRRALKGWQGGQAWYPAKVLIALADGEICAMNPAHIIYECLTNSQWGRGLPQTTLDEASFRACADTLYDEKFGLCLRWNRKDSINTFIRSVLDHIGGVLFTDRATGLIKLKLIRQDYEPDNVPVYDTSSGLIEFREASVAATSNAVCEMIVQYVDPITGEDRSVRVHNLAAFQANKGTINSVTTRYPGIPTADLALRVAQRDLRIQSLPLRRFQVVFDRAMWRINPGDVFRISNPERSLSNLILRVGSVDYGTLTSGRITVTAVQDVFSLPLTSYSKVEPPRWSPPDVTPRISQWVAFEMPYFLLHHMMRPSDFEQIGPNTGYIGVVAEKPSALSTNYELAVRYGAPEPDDWEE